MTRLAEWTMLSHGWRRFLLMLVLGAIAGTSVPPLFVLPALFFTFPFWVWALDGAAAVVVHAVAFVGWGIVLLSTFLIDHFDLFGLRQTWLAFRGVPYTQKPFAERSLYRRVRHPLMLGFLIAFWAAPVMTVSHLVFAGAFTAFILVALVFEERDLVDLHGEAYRAYRQRVPKLLPRVVPARERARSA